MKYNEEHFESYKRIIEMFAVNDSYEDIQEFYQLINKSIRDGYNLVEVTGGTNRIQFIFEKILKNSSVGINK